MSNKILRVFVILHWINCTIIWSFRFLKELFVISCYTMTLGGAMIDPPDS